MVKRKNTQRSKIKFRSSKEWKEFRSILLQSSGGICQCCGTDCSKRTKMLNIHHKDLDAAHYTDISNFNHFSVLCHTCHKIIHQLHAKVIKKNGTQNQLLIDFQNPFFI